MACASKEEEAFLKEYNKDRAYHTRLLQSEKVAFFDLNGTEVLLTATYLFDRHSQKKTDNNEEVFIIGFYENEGTNGLFSKEFNLTLEGKAPTHIKVLSKKERERKHIPMLTAWGEYFEVHFPSTDKIQFDLIFSSREYGKKRLHFSKKAKYLFTKEAF